jgi:tRNA(Ile)-lysidine synthase TilS/MesJ
MLPSSGNYIRPLLRVHKQELVTYLKSKGLHWMDDASNSSRDYTRNKIRLDAVPALSTIAGGNEALNRSSLYKSLDTFFILLKADDPALRAIGSIG